MQYTAGPWQPTAQVGPHYQRSSSATKHELLAQLKGREYFFRKGQVWRNRGGMVDTC